MIQCVVRDALRKRSLEMNRRCTSVESATQAVDPIRESCRARLVPSPSVHLPPQECPRCLSSPQDRAAPAALTRCWLVGLQALNFVVGLQEVKL